MVGLHSDNNFFYLQPDELRHVYPQRSWGCANYACFMGWVWILLPRRGQRQISQSSMLLSFFLRIKGIMSGSLKPYRRLTVIKNHDPKHNEPSCG
jgi:hypothetical protein